MNSYITLDKNMAVNNTIGDLEIQWHDIKQPPFALHGFYKPLSEPFFRRLPQDVGEATSNEVNLLSRESSGGRVRFSTNSPYIAIRAKFLVVGRSSHLTLISSAGFDLYTDGEYGSQFIKEFRMPYDMVDSYEQVINMRCNKMRTYTINFPVHSVVESLEIGLAPDSRLDAPKPYRNIAPVVIYGSSIVHGTAATRPGLTYPCILSRALNIDFLNLGFSGNAKGEDAIAKYMAELPMSIFVCDYDHNAPTVEDLKKTHYSMYETIRKKNPDLPYIMITRPNYWTRNADKEDTLSRRDVVMTSYLKARESGDKNVYFIDGMSFGYKPHTYDLSVDSVHPNDAGFVRMADAIESVVTDILERME